ncbi:hypothetical protein C6P40_002549 [Pichia californica]|uniref:Phospholipid scramblase n=1 Tax=Pichia californica TaxID=460514 RepID=A0A9P6WJP5_9ASCO|nr:hypothetical protein C6P42_002002 [[Candida] californica]KAG0687298.1 hypothetical protein C6P40_002549 [[Candida] californica]
MFKSILNKEIQLQRFVFGKRWYSPLNYDRSNRGRRDRIYRESKSYSPEQIQIEEPLNHQVNYSSDKYRESENSIINSNHSCFQILSQPTLIIERRIEYMNLFLGFEQANKYALYDAMGNQIGWLIERDFGIGKAIMRQIYKLHRPFIVDVLDINGNLLLTIKRPFSFINSHIKAILPIKIDNNDIDNKLLEKSSDIDSDGIIVGESVQSWHLWRRRYNLFESINDGNGGFKQFGKIDSGFLRWEFPVFDKDGLVYGSISRNFNGLFREALTDTGVYVLRMDPSSFENGESEFGPIDNKSLTLDEKAVMLANAVSIDFDYFSRHSGVGGGGFLFFGGGGDDI